MRRLIKDVINLCDYMENKKKYKLYFVDKSSRLQAMLVCSLRRRIDWCEDGLKLVTWNYNCVGQGEAENLNQIFKKYSKLNIDKRKKKQTRTINLADIIYFDGEAWIVFAFGFKRIPDILWKKILH